MLRYFINIREDFSWNLFVRSCMETISHQNGNQRNEQQEWIELYAHALRCMHGKQLAINYVLTMVLYVIKECCVRTSIIKHRGWSQEPIQHEVKPSVVWCLENPH